MPTSVATCISGRPLLSSKATASRLNSGENSLLVFAIKHLHALTGLAKVSTELRDHHSELVRDVELLDAFQHLRLGPTDCLRAVFHIFVDRVAEGHFAAAGLSNRQVFEGAGLGKVLFALLDPGCGGRAQLKGPVLAPDDFSSPPNGDLGEPGYSAVFALSLDDGTHWVTTFGLSYNICCKPYPKRARFTTN